MENDMCEVVIIGAGPSGAIAGALLNGLGHKVVILEKEVFPRFSIGESLLPQCMEFIAEAGMLDAVKGAGFQFKNGAAFACKGMTGSFDFREKFSSGPATTFQVQRDNFDKVLADCAESQGVEIRYGCEILSVNHIQSGVQLGYRTPEGKTEEMVARYVLDASGFGRVLPRFLRLDRPSDFPVRRAVFAHIQDNISQRGYDREKILIVVHPEFQDVWYWLIPFSNGRCSIGVVAKREFFESLGTSDNDGVLRELVDASPDLRNLLSDAKFDTPAQSITGYSCSVSSLYGENYALLGNAGEFLDPVFSSGVTIAMKSASLAAPLVSKQLKGEAVDWQHEYVDVLSAGINTFRAYVESWYEGVFQQVVFSKEQNLEVRDMISSILAGYV